jgi:two-component system, sensor histidine kinase YesM
MKRVTNIFGRFSLRTRLIISSVLCILLPSVLTYIITNYLIKDEQVNRAVTQTEGTLQVLDQNITQYFDDLLYLSNYIQFDSQINSILKQNIKRNDNNVYTQDLYARDYLEISRNLEGVTNLLEPSYLTISLENGFNFVNYPNNEYNSTNLLNKTWFKEIRNLNDYGTHWVGVHPNYIEPEKEENPYLISIARLLKLTEMTDALILISINEREINSLFKQIDFDKEQELMLINAEGVILSANNETQILRKNKYLEEIKNKKDNFSIVHYHNKDYLLVSYPLSYADWTLVSMVPYESAIGKINMVTKNSLLFQIIFYTIFLIILIILVKNLTKPVTRLSFVMNEAENGNLKVRSGINGPGDVEKLGYSLDNMLDKIENMLEQIKKEENSKRKAELEMLQAQINPHFLFNILNSIRLKILIDGDENIANLIQSLSLLLRMTINRNNEFIPLEKEIEVIEHYIKLMNFRGKYNFEIKKECELNTLVEEVPRFFLQPIIENSIIHGYKQKSGIIVISTWMEDGFLLIQVKDNGKGFHPEDLEILKRTLSTTMSTNKLEKNESSFTGIGITNVYQRMLLIYGEKFHLEIENQPLGGVIITFYIPRNKEESKNV